MKKIILPSLLSLFLSVSLFAKEPFVQVMSISDINNVEGAKSKIKKLGYKSRVNKYGKWYIIYAGPFENNEKATQALKVIKKRVSKGAILTELKVKSSKKTVRKEPIVVVPVQKKAVPKALPKETPVSATAAQKSVKKIENSSVKENAAVPKKIVPAVAKEKKIVSAPIVKTVEKEESAPLQDKQGKSLYIGLSAGSSVVNIEQNNIDGTIPLLFEIKDSGINYGVEIGYYFNDNIFLSLNYQLADFEGVSIDSAFATLNYQLDEFYSISPFVGIVAGNSIRSWDKNPVPSESEIGSVSSFLVGAQIGSDISLSYNFSLYFYYRYLMMDTTTNISTIDEKASIKYENEQNLNLGLKYNF
ncbi:MAG: SPOR domain-containing protein [Campylobacterota bacterium]|nr:SPOR domain-containing protein [Campylobacterota bacterium]